MISDWQCDTTEPRNLNDSDLDEGTTEMPPSRPETENTTVLGDIARRRMLIALGAISDFTVTVKPSSYAEVMRHDGILREARESVPPPLKMKPLAASVTDPPQLIMARLFISHMYYKGQILLHRRFLHTESPRQDEDIFAYSRNTCLDASISILDIQNILDEETCPGGQLSTMRWRISSGMNHSFLTATMVLCSLINSTHNANLNVSREEEILTALRRTRTIWMQKSPSSQEAKKAAETISLVLARVSREQPQDFQSTFSRTDMGPFMGDHPPNVHEESNTGTSFSNQTLTQNDLSFYDREFPTTPPVCYC